MRWLLLTNYAMYLLVIKSQSAKKQEKELEKLAGESPKNGAILPAPSLKYQKYNADLVIPLSQLDYISVSTSGLM